MVVRTFYWDGAERSVKARLRRALGTPAGPRLRVGNAGDLYNRDLVRFLYGEDPQNVSTDGSRLLLVGSIVHRVAAGDIIAGVGTKGSPLPTPPENVSVVGVRGPITLDALRSAGYDTSEVRFALDPGLLAARIYPDESREQPIPGRVAFIPHYRDLDQFRSTTSLHVISVDAEPADFVREIARSEYVYSSSLHGVIFAHSIGRPCTLVAPRNPEPVIKYRDYFASIGLSWEPPRDIEEALQAVKAQVVDGVPNDLHDFDFPDRSRLIEDAILVGLGSRKAG